MTSSTTTPRIGELTLPDLVRYALKIGLYLVQTNDPARAPLYVYLDDRGIVRYIGKSEAEGGKRHSDHDRWFKDWAPFNQLRVGMKAAIAERQLNRVMLEYTDSGARQLDTWHGDAVDFARIELASPLDVRQVEAFLIRVAVATGTPLFNASGASMWEGPWGSPLDTAAQVAVSAVQDEMQADTR